MNFKLSKSPRYWWPVTVRFPDPDNVGSFQDQQLKIQFEPRPRSEEIERSERAAELKTLREIVDWQIADFKRVVKNWDNVVDGNGEAVPFTEEALEMALQFPWFRDALSKAFKASMEGDEARLGN